MRHQGELLPAPSGIPSLLKEQRAASQTLSFFSLSPSRGLAYKARSKNVSKKEEVRQKTENDRERGALLWFVSKISKFINHSISFKSKVLFVCLFFLIQRAVKAILAFGLSFQPMKESQAQKVIIAGFKINLFLCPVFVNSQKWGIYLFQKIG